MITTLLFLTLILNLYTTIKVSNLKYKSKVVYFLLFLNITLTVSTATCFVQSYLPIEYIDKLGIFFEYISAISLISFAPITFTVFLLFVKPNLDLKKIFFIYLIPGLALLSLWTNDFHGLYFQEYSIYYGNIVYGKAYMFNLLYAISLHLVSTIGFSYFAYNKQSKYEKISKLFLIYNAILVVYVVLNLTVPTTNALRIFAPIMFSPFAFIFTFGVMELNLIDIFPIVTKEITNIMTDPFLLLSPKGIVLETNTAFEKYISKKEKVKIGDDFFKLAKESDIYNYNDLVKLIKKAYKTGKVQTLEFTISTKTKEIYYDIDAQTILDDNKECLSILIIFKNTTKQKNDLLTIEHDHEILTMQQQMSIVGELASGFAHDLNTPITAIKTGLSILKCNPNLAEEDKKRLAEMEEESSKILEFSSNIRTQIREIGTNEKTLFSVNELIKNLVTISTPELNKKDCYVTLNEIDNCMVYGERSKLSQVLLNIISNSIDAYNKKGEIIVTIKKIPRRVYIEIEDFAGGIDESIAKQIFKKILTAQSKTKTGMGLYISYSIIKSMFGGEISFLTTKDVGTKFVITLPLPKEQSKEDVH